MKGIAARVQVNADRTVEVKLPDGLPAGEYEAVLIPVKKSSVDNSQTADVNKGEQWNRATDEFWDQWTKAVEQMSLSARSAQSEYHRTTAIDFDLEQYAASKTGGAVAENIRTVSKACSSLPVLDGRHPDDILSYNEVGLPE